MKSAANASIATSATRPASLDGLTLMRYAHLYRKRTSGGVEQYLRQLDHGLLSRNQLTVLQMHLVDSSTPEQVEEEAVGRGRIIWIPVAMRKGRSRITDFAGRVRAI